MNDIETFCFPQRDVVEYDINFHELCKLIINEISSTDVEEILEYFGENKEEILKELGIELNTQFWVDEDFIVFDDILVSLEQYLNENHYYD